MSTPNAARRSRFLPASDAAYRLPARTSGRPDTSRTERKPAPAGRTGTGDVVFAGGERPSYTLASPEDWSGDDLDLRDVV